MLSQYHSVLLHRRRPISHSHTAQAKGFDPNCALVDVCSVLTEVQSHNSRTKKKKNSEAEVQNFRMKEKTTSTLHTIHHRIVAEQQKLLGRESGGPFFGNIARE